MRASTRAQATTSLICDYCANPFTVNTANYAVVHDAEAPHLCVICRLLAKYRHAAVSRDAPATGDPTSACAAQSASVPRSGYRTRTDLYRPIRAWIARHGGAVPRTKDFRADPTLPSFDVIYRYFGGLERLFLALEAVGETGIVSRYCATAAAQYQRDTRTAGRASAQAKARKHLSQQEGTA